MMYLLLPLFPLPQTPISQDPLAWGQLKRQTLSECFAYVLSEHCVLKLQRRFALKPISDSLK